MIEQALFILPLSMGFLLKMVYYRPTLPRRARRTNVIILEMQPDENLLSFMVFMEIHEAEHNRVPFNFFEYFFLRDS